MLRADWGGENAKLDYWVDDKQVFHWECFECNHEWLGDYKGKEKAGCGKDIPTGIPPRIWDCTRTCGSDPKQLCEECKSKINQEVLK